jgi:Zn-dependent protease
VKPYTGSFAFKIVPGKTLREAGQPDPVDRAEIHRHITGSPTAAGRQNLPFLRPVMRAKLAKQLKQSGVFLDLMTALLALAALMAALPAYARFMVFPFVLTGWLISLCLHEFGHAMAAYRFGDSSVAGKGYLTLNPLRYTDVQLSIIWPLVFMAFGGIGLPGGAVYLNLWRLSSPQRAWVSAAGPLATLAVLILLLAFMGAAGDALAAKPALYAAVAFLALLQLTALVLNLLPVPGLDGWGIIEPWLPPKWREFGARAAPIAPALLYMSFFLVSQVNEMFWRLVLSLSHLIGLRWELAREGLHLFRFWS